jgi:hypothetical protein
VLIIPLYAIFSSTVPPDSTFDAKKMLKRVLRKSDLPPSHPSKPKTWFGKAASRAMASVAGEALTALGYEVEIRDFGGCVKVARVRLEATGSNCVWVGVFNKWYFVTQTDDQGRRIVVDG